MRVCPRCTSETEAEVCPADGARTIAVQPGQATYHGGTLIADRYQVDGVLGIGGFGAVYRCTQLTMNQTVAVKVLRSEHLSSVEHIKRFTREAQAVSKLSHPNTIRIFDFGSHSDGALYLAMEFLEGETLAERIERHTVLPWQAVVRIATQICHSLTEAHGQGLVHRDLKPENVMLMAVAGDPDFVKVLDFGIAKVQKEPGKPGEASLTETGMIMGTPTYMSPEQAKGDPIDGRSDIYSLGVMLFEALTGLPPFHDETAMKVLVAHIQSPVPAFARSGREEEAPPALEQVVRRCLEKEPSRRPQTTAELAELLAATLQPASPRAAQTADDGAPTAMMTAVERLPVTVEITGPMATRHVAATDPRQQVATAAATTAPPGPALRTPLWLGVGALAAVAVMASVAWLLVRPTAAAVHTEPETSGPADPPAQTPPRGAKPLPAAAQGAVVGKAPAAQGGAAASLERPAAEVPTERPPTPALAARPPAGGAGAVGAAAAQTGTPPGAPPRSPSAPPAVADAPPVRAAADARPDAAAKATPAASQATVRPAPAPLPTVRPPAAPAAGTAPPAGRPAEPTRPAEAKRPEPAAARPESPKPDSPRSEPAKTETPKPAPSKPATKPDWNLEER
jgi:hypothetical protein